MRGRAEGGPLMQAVGFRRGSQQVLAHRLRCQTLPPLKPGEHERLVAAFLAVRGVTVCPARYAAPVEQLSPSRSYLDAHGFGLDR